MMEENPLFYLFVVLTLVLAFAYFFGARYNKKLGRVTFRILEEVLRPKQKSYTNIGGLIGYNFNYKSVKSKKISHINGVLTLLPRQSPLYLPIAKIFGRSDKLYLTIFAKTATASGAWHILHSKCAQAIKIGDLKSKKVKAGGQSFSVFCENEADFLALTNFLQTAQPKFLRHMAYHPQDSSFAMFWIPGNFWQEFEHAYDFVKNWA